MNSPFAAPAFLVLALVFLFTGERLFGTDPTLRIVFDVLGVAGLVASFYARGRRLTAMPDEIRRWIAWIHVGLIVGLLLYVVQLPAVLGKLGFTGDSEKAARVVLGTLWPIKLAVSVLAGLFLDAALISSRHMPSPETLRLRASAQTGTVLGLLVSIFAVGNYLVSAHAPETDLSRRKIGRPSEATMEVVKNLETPLFVNVFFPPSNEVELEVETYLRSLESGSGGKILVHHYDHALSPKMAKRVNARDNGALYLTRQSLEEGMPEEGEPPPVPSEKLQLGLKIESAKSMLKKFDAELQKRVLKLARGSRKIYFTAGHGERNAKGGGNVDKEDGRAKLSLLNRYLGTQNYESKLFSAADGLANEVPADAAALVLAGPTEPLLEAEVDAIKRYFDGGGSVLVFIENGHPQGVPTELLAHLGVTYDPALVANERIFVVESKQVADRVLLATNKTTSHPSVTTLSRNREQLFVAMPRTGTVGKIEGTPRNVQLVLSSMPGGWRDSNGNFQKDAGEIAAADKLSLIAAIEGEKKDGKSGKAIVAGSAEMIDDRWIRIDGNIVFIADAVKWMVGDEKLQAPVALSEEDIAIKHTTKEDTIWFYATIFLAPAMVLAGGLGWVQRSRQRKGGAR